jgi:colicin import membrane protein
MARNALIGEGQWFELADSLAAAGDSPTVKALHATAKERFGVAASYTTIQRILESWRRMGGADRAPDLGPQALDLVLKAFTPLYQQLRAEARNELEPRVLEAEQQAEDATLRRQALQAELTQLSDERAHLREQLQAVGERERELTATLATALSQVAEMKSLLEAAVQTHQQQLDAAQARLREQEARQVIEREHAQEQHHRAVAELRTRCDTELESLGVRHRAELERVQGELMALREPMQQALEARSTADVQKAELETRLAAALTAQAQLRERTEGLTLELQTVQGKSQRFEQTAATARAANAQMAAAYQRRIDELQGALDTLAHGQAAMQAQFEQLLQRFSKRRLPGGEAT